MDFVALHESASGPRLFSNSGHGVKLSVKILAGSMVLSAVGRALRMMA